ncbi:hypothetical protein A2392_01600 [Candidatus Kaiserbacteria bacterium RIFOXYB1_FULL_46_14]|uniref:Uncharacterized protein n=1 Tax=Candidatus Kaiserbacteria bacterium RIFOXYB1_FULL_46_14 TaxID=1798531 RepID=A0A1F6FJV6_9BACT|nr:MAG: hypothetical protein A2392_01600 [Candidatus Kaiserbacteria bacterium RIFOXYB1_FULL_46_14]
MSEQTMTEENKKTIVAFIAGLLIGGLLVFIFANPADREEKRVDGNTVPETAEENSDTPNEDVTKQPENKTEVVPTTNKKVSLSNVTFPADAGWVGIRDYEGGQLTGLLGVARFNKAENLTPTEVTLLRPTVSGKTYAIVFYSDNGDKVFDLATDAQVDAEVSSFVAR